MSMCVVVWVSMCARVGVYARARVCMHVCVMVWIKRDLRWRASKVCVCVHTYACVCVCVCFVREKEREREREGEGERGEERG